MFRQVFIVSSRRTSPRRPWHRQQDAAEEDARQVDAADSPQLVIPGVNHGGIRDWVPVDDFTLLIQDNFKKWYRVKLMVPSRQLAYAENLGFVTGPSGILDNTGAIVVRGQTYRPHH